MQLAKLGPRRPVCIDAEADLQTASRLMRSQGVNELVVTLSQEGARSPAGMITARDIVTRALAVGLDPSIVTAGDLLWAPPVAARLDDGVVETLNRLCALGSESMPVLNGDGKVVGVISLDELLQAVARSEPSRAYRLHR